MSEFEFKLRFLLHQNLFFRVSVDFMEPISSSPNNSFKTKNSFFRIELTDNRELTCNVRFGNIKIHPRNEWPQFNVDLQYMILKNFVLKPRIITTDESLRSLSPKKLVLIFE